MQPEKKFCVIVICILQKNSQFSPLFNPVKNLEI